MPPNNPQNRLDKKNLNKDGQKTTLLTKDGLKPIGVQSNLMKKSGASYAFMESTSFNTMVKDARDFNKDAEQGSRDPKSIVKDGVRGVADTDRFRFVSSENPVFEEGHIANSDDVMAEGDNTSEGGQISKINGEVTEIKSGNREDDIPVKQSELVNNREDGGVVFSEDPNKKSGEESDQSKKWSEIVKPKTSFGRMKFSVHTPEISEGKIIIKPPLSVDLQGKKAWENCLVGYFFEKRVAYHTIEYHANRKWKSKGLVEVIMNDDGFFFF